MVSSAGMLLGKSWVLEIEGVGRLTIPVIDKPDYPNMKIIKMIKMEQKKIDDPQNKLRPDYPEILEKYKVEIDKYDNFVKYNEFVPTEAGRKCPVPYRAPCNTSFLNNVYLEMNGNLSPEDQLKYSQLMLSMIGTGPVFEKEGQADNEKMKILDAFMAFCPRQALALQLEAKTYNLSLAELKEEIFKFVDSPPQDAAKIGFMVAVERGVKEITAADGRKINGISNKAQTVREACEKAGNPVYGLMAGVGGTPNDPVSGGPKPLTDNNIYVASLILMNGFMSTVARLHAGVVLDGDSPGSDLASGGGDAVYYRAINEGTVKHECKEFPLAGTFQFVVGLEAVNDDPNARVSKQDSFGEFDPKNVANSMLNPALNTQENMTEFFTTLTDEHKKNEVMVTGTSKPTHIQGMVVRTESEKKQMIDGLVKNNDEFKNKFIVGGKINGIPLNDFVHVGTHFKKEMWKV
jgi:hypothetical protein